MKIWRYVDLQKFVNMLATRTLHFACVSSFNDPYEGWLPRSYVEANVALIRGTPETLEISLEDASKIHMQGLKEMIEKYGANCWHINEGESEAMWRLYGDAGAEIAIESTRERLEDAMRGSGPYRVHIEPVRYMDFDNDPIDKGHRHQLSFIKRRSFEHERELRAVVKLPEPGKGVSQRCSMDTLIAKIHIAPQARQYYIDAVRWVIDHADPKLDAPVEISKLFDRPDY